MAKRTQQVTLTRAAEQLGVHYMTAYRYVRSGRLPATKVGQEWLVDEADLAAFARAQAGGASRPRGARRAQYPAQLLDRLVHADESGAWLVVEQALASGMDPDEVLVDLLVPALHTIGTQWAAGSLTVAQEHQASAVATRLVGRLGPRFARRGRKRGHIVLGAAPNDEHALPSAILSDLLRGRGFAVTDLGANVPVVSWAETARVAAAASPALVALGICATTKHNTAAIGEAITAIHAETTVPVVLGGHGVRSAKQAADLGADRFSASTAEAAGILAALGGLGDDDAPG